jgi:hypothetical protein
VQFDGPEARLPVLLCRALVGHASALHRCTAPVISTEELQRMLCSFYAITS